MDEQDTDAELAALRIRDWSSVKDRLSEAGVLVSLVVIAAGILKFLLWLIP